MGYSKSFREILAFSLLLVLMGTCAGMVEVDKVQAQTSQSLHPEKRLAGATYTGFLRVQGRWLVDQAGNVVILRGANFFRYEYGELDTHSEADYKKMASWGFNVVRLPIAWNLIEPKPNEYDDTYLQSTVDRDLAWAEKYGIHIIIDMHQYGWSPHFTWFDSGGTAGLPSWAVSAYNNTLAGEGQSRADFWNGLGPNGSPPSESNPSMQDRFFAMWQHLARRYSNSTVVAGYDIFNEPYSYSVDYRLRPDELWTIVPKFLATFYAKSVDFIHAVDPNHICFWEPPGDSPNRPNTAYSPHYPGQDDFEHYDAVKVRSAVERVVTSSQAWNVPVFIGEWGMLSSAGDVATYIRDFSDLMDKYLMSSAWWSYGKGGFQMYLLDESGNERVILTQNLVRPYVGMSSAIPSYSSFTSDTKKLVVSAQGPYEMRIYVSPFHGVAQANADRGSASTFLTSLDYVVGVSIASGSQLDLIFFTLPVHSSASPDLTVESVWLENSSQPGQPASEMSAGQQFDIVITVKNIGDATAYDFYLDAYYDNEYGRGGPDEIAPSEVQTWYVGPLTAESGTHATRWVVDPDNQIAELNETNNENTYRFTVGPTTTQYYLAVSSAYDSPNPVSGWVDAGTPITASVTSPVTGGTGTQYVCTGWTGSGAVPASGSSCSVTFTMDAPSSISWNWKAQYQLTMQVNPSSGGTTTPAVGTYWYDSGQNVSIQAFPASGYAFTSWAGSGSGSYTGVTNLASVTMNGPVTETATFAKRTGAIISAVTVTPNPVVQGSAALFKTSVQNLGTSTLSSLKVQLTIYGPDGKQTGSGSGNISKLAAGATSNVKITYAVSSSASPGAWTCRISLYSGSTILDQKTDGSFTVNTAIIAASIASVSDSPDPVATGRTVTFTVTFTNTGNTVWSSSSINIKLYKSDGALGTTLILKVSNIQPGAKYTCQIAWKVPSSGPRGTWRYEVYLYYGSILTATDTAAGSTVTVK